MLYKDKLIENYPIRLRIVICSVLFTIAIFSYIFPRILDYNKIGSDNKTDNFDSIEIPPLTDQVEIVKPPPRPSVPVASEDDEFDMDISIEDTDLDDFEDYQPPSFSDDDEVFDSWNVEQLPKERPGREVRKFIEYPDIAREAGIEGRVVIEAVIGKKGRIETARVIAPVFPSLDEAALEAVYKSIWTPAMQGSKKVKVKIIIPVEFKLSN